MRLYTRGTAYVTRHAHAIAGGIAVAMLAPWAASIVGIIALHDAASDLILWPAIAAFVLSGWLLAARMPRNSVGWLLLLTAVGLSFMPWSVLSSWMLNNGIGAGKWTAGLSNASFVFIVGGLGLLLPLAFPDGGLPSRHRWWRIVLWCDLGYMFFASFNLFDTEPLHLPALHQQVANPFVTSWVTPALGALIGACVPMLMVGFAGSFSAIVVRWRAAGAAERAQMKWVILALVLAPVPFLLHDYAQHISDTTMVIVVPLVPVAVTVSVLRYRLYDIDRIISRAVGYLLITGLLVGVYIGCIAIADLLLPVGSSVGVAASTLAAAALFQPVRRRVQVRVDRRFNRERFDGARTIDAFALRLRDEVDPDVVRADLLTVATRAVQPVNVSLWMAP
jgi:hypothetical protein